MSMIKIENLTFAYPTSGDYVFENLHLQVDTDWKLGVIGRNGRGKTTLFRLLQGLESYTGTIVHSVSFDYFPMNVPVPQQSTEEVLQQLCPMRETWEFICEFSQLDLSTDILARPFQTLSGGEQTKVLLAALFLGEGNFLLIDEPTNHLDAHGRACVAAYLKRKKGFMLISHDRHFLDACVDHILALNKETIECQSGNFSSWFVNFNHQQEQELERNQQLKKEVLRLQQSMRQSANWSHQKEATKIGPVDKGFVGHKAAKLMKRSKSIEARRKKAIDEKAALLKNIEKHEPLKLVSLPYSAGPLLSLSDVSLFYDHRRLCFPISFSLSEGERLFIEGKNGSGKSSLLRCILDSSVSYTGTIKRSSHLIISYVPQTTDHLNGTLRAFIQEHQLDETQFKTILRKLGFARQQFEKKIENYSSGQKKKILIAKSLCEKAHLYIWDEPLNFIDLYARIQIEQLIQEVKPTMIVVEHDQAFKQTLATRVLTLETNASLFNTDPSC